MGTSTTLRRTGVSRAGHAARLIVGPPQLPGKVHDRLFYDPDLTLGYLLVARKRAITDTSNKR